MENILRRIFNGNVNERDHEEFIKFSRGEFKDRYLIEAKKQKDKWSIKTSYEFANYFVKEGLNNFQGNIKVQGVIVYTGALTNSKINVERVKQFMGIKQYIINGEASAQDILELMKEHPKAFYALTFSAPGYELKIKAKAPKSSKPSTKGGEEPKADFCSLKTTNKEIVKDLFFDVDNFNEIKAKHNIKINDIVMPKDIEDPVKMRELAKKKGKIIRELTIDGRKDIKEKDFEI